MIVRPFYWFLCISTLFILPAFLFGGGGYDYVFHMLWSKHFLLTLQDTWFPRWALGLTAGCGSPVFFFYPSLAYYFTSLFSLLPHYSDWIAISFTALIFTFISCIGCYKWLTNFCSNKAAFFATLCFIVLPYKWHDFYYRNAFTEYVAIALIPFLLCFTHQIANKHKRAIFYFSFFYACLLFSNIPAAIIASLLIGAYYMALCRQSKKFFSATTVYFILALLLGYSLASFYILIPLFQINNIHIDAIKPLWPGFDYKNTFIFTQLLKETIHGSYVSFVSFTSMLMVCITFVLLRKRVDSHNTIFVRFWLYSGLAAFFLMLPLSDVFWEYIPFLKTIRHAPRFNIVLLFSITALIGYAFTTFNLKHQTSSIKWIFANIFVCFILPLAFSQIVTSRYYADALFHEKWRYYRYNTDYFYEYIPKTTDLNVLSPDNIGLFTSLCEKHYTVLSGDASVTVQKWRPRSIIFTTDVKSSSVIHISQLYYPGWTANSVDGKTQYTIVPQERTGIMTLRFKPGIHHVHIHLPLSFLEKAGFVISAISFMVLVFGLFKYRSNA